jgi:hypothetical protein
MVNLALLAPRMWSAGSTVGGETNESCILVTKPGYLSFAMRMIFVSTLMDRRMIRNFVERKEWGSGFDVFIIVPHTCKRINSCAGQCNARRSDWLLMTVSALADRGDYL